MPFRPEHSLLRVDVDKISTIDTRSVENLFGIWSVFSKTSDAMEDGKRLENLSWRLWNRETFCCAPQSQARSTTSLSPRCSFPAKPKTASHSSIPVPELSSSLDSLSSEESDDEDTSSHVNHSLARPHLRRHDSIESRSRGCEKHITPIDLEKIVISIKEKKELEPLDMPLPTASTPSKPAEKGNTFTSPEHSPEHSPMQMPTISQPQNSEDDDSTPHPSSSHATLLESSASTVNTDGSPESNRAGSDASSSTEMSTHSIVRGFIPGGAPSSYRSQTQLATQPTPILRTSPNYQPTKPKKKGAMFTIGTSSGEEESSLESHMYKSSLSESLKRPSSKKQTSFKEEVAIARPAEDSPVFEDSDEEETDEEEEVSESAIDDDDDSDDGWEDEETQSGHSSLNDKELFQRVDSRPNLTSRRSLLTTLMHEPDRARALANAASRSTPALRRSRTTTPNGPSVATSPQQPDEHLQVPGQENARSKPIIMTTSNTHQPQQLALSPRTTRRNMLSTELTESLRKNLLWERQHKSTGNLAALKRRHTSNDVKNLKQHPEPAPILSQKEGAAKNFNNDYFHAGLQEYHAKGW